MSRPPNNRQPTPPNISSLRRQSSYGRPEAQQQPVPPMPSKPSRPSRGPPPVNGHVTLNGAMDRRKSRVDTALLRKRQSISYSQAEANGLLPVQNGRAIPSMPAIPAMHAARMDQSASLGSAPAKYAELNREGLDVDAYLKRLLANNSQQSSLDVLKSLKAELQASLDENAQELQKSVLTNYSDFVTISQELTALEAEMLELRAVLEEWRGVPESLELSTTESDISLGGSLGSSTGRRQRNSIADLAVVYRNQLEALWEAIEGSQKFLPPLPGRHVILQTAAFAELNAATYKPKGPAQLVLLNDSLLVATQRKRQMGSKLRLVAEKCFLLNEIVVVDIKDGTDLKHAVKLKRGKETYIFCADKVEEKRNLLAAFKRVAEEMINKKRKQSIWEAESRKDASHSTNRMSMLNGPNSQMPAFDPYTFFGMPGNDMMGKGQPWIGDLTDEITVATATREYETATAKIEKARSAYPLMQTDQTLLNEFRTQIDQQANNLIANLLQNLGSATIGKSAATKTALWLLRLGEADRSRETFLAGRSAIVKRRVKQIKFEGDIEVYVGELAMVVFTLIKNTCEWYMAAFKDNKMASGFVRWAALQVELFSEIFQRQVSGAQQDRQMVEDALAVTRTHSLMLRDVGLDFGFMLDKLLLNMS